MASTKALILPADTPPRHTSIKRHLLFFDSLLIVDPETDLAILNKGDISETFPNGRTISWGEYGSYSRSPDYIEAHRALFVATHKLQSQGKIRILKPPPPAIMDPKFNWISSAAASREESLIRAALPDYRPGTDAYYYKHDGWYNSVVPRDTNYESRYQWMLETQHHEMPGIDIEWNRVGWVRLGRTLKSLRRAGSEGAVPLALDSINQNICVTLGSRAYHQPPSASDLASQAIALDAVDPVSLDDALEDMTWDEVVRLRKEVLPYVAKLRKLLEDSVAAARRPQNADLEVYSRTLAEIREKHKKSVDEVRETWRRLKFKPLETTVAVASGGLTTLATPGGWAPIVVALTAGFIGKMAQGTAADLHKLVTASRAKKASPLFFFDVLPAEAQKIARKERPSTGS
ncbi:hypothetical protein [Sorangium sp. So ce861]|uniref:hypothetical protein n=1 Tax=Sorangium sp. So ce861 TaxID=3133323 RepID=UPI003F5EB89C